MQPEELKQRTKQFNEFGSLLLKHYRHKLVTRQTGNEPAKRLGRYLRAARVNAGLSPASLAKRTRLPQTTILALETGLIAAQDIEYGWLRRLAQALAEDTEDLELILGPQTLKQRSFTWLKALKWRRLAQSTLLQKQIVGRLPSETRLRLRSIYAAGLMLLICLMAVAFWQYAPKPSAPTSPTEIQKSSGYQSQIEPEVRLSLIKAESSVRNRVWIPKKQYLQFSSEVPLAVAKADFDTKPPVGFSPLGHIGPSETPQRLNMLQAEQRLKIAAFIQPAYAPIRLDAYCCGIQP